MHECITSNLFYSLHADKGHNALKQYLALGSLIDLSRSCPSLKYKLITPAAAIYAAILNGYDNGIVGVLIAMQVPSYVNTWNNPRAPLTVWRAAL